MYSLDFVDIVSDVRDDVHQVLDRYLESVKVDRVIVEELIVYQPVYLVGNQFCYTSIFGFRL